MRSLILVLTGVGKEKERDQEDGNVMPGVGILIVIAGVVTLIVRGTGDVALGKEIQVLLGTNQIFSYLTSSPVKK
jgi:hypothetical protein